MSACRNCLGGGLVRNTGWADSGRPIPRFRIQIDPDRVSTFRVLCRPRGGFYLGVIHKLFAQPGYGIDLHNFSTVNHFVNPPGVVLE